jgi:hypothetical protein
MARNRRMSSKLGLKQGKGRGRARGLSTKRGAAPSTALALLALALVGAAVAWWQLRPGRSGADSSAGAAQPAVDPARPNAQVDNLESQRLDRPAAALAGDRRYLPEMFDPARFEGVARLEVLLDVDGEVPAHWTLLLEPSKVVAGGQHAVRREVRSAGAERKVVLDDVALGGYVIRAQAEGMECTPQYIQFAKPDEIFVVLRLRLYPAGTLSGRVVDPDGDPVAGLPVSAVRRDAEGQRETQTDGAGHYAFERLPDGEWEVLVGYPRAPLVRREINFAAPGLSMPELATPAIDELAVRVVDTKLQPVEGASVSVIGLASGARLATTDANGLARLPHCVGGEASVIVDAPNFTTNTQQILFQPGVLSEHQVRLASR